MPAQTLMLMNQPVVVESARALAAAITKATRNDEGRVRQAFLRVLTREPSAEEMAMGVEFLSPGGESLALLCQGLFQSAEFRLLP